MDTVEFKKAAGEFGNHEFCEIRFNKTGAGASVQVFVQNVPEASGTANHSFEIDNQRFRDFIEQLISLGWRQFWTLADSEVFVARLLKLGELDPQYEYAVLKCIINLDEAQNETLIRLDSLFDLGKSNKSMMFSGGFKANFKDYVGALEYLERDKWEFTHERDYPTAFNSPHVRVRLRYFKRPVNPG